MKRHFLWFFAMVLLCSLLGCEIGMLPATTGPATTQRPAASTAQPTTVQPTTAPAQTTEPAFPTTAPTPPPTEPAPPPTEQTIPPTEPIEPPTEPTVPPTEPAVSPTEPTTPPTEPALPPTESAVPPTESTIPPTEPTVPPTEPVQPVPEPLPELDAGKYWVATCENSMSLRSEPDTDARSIMKIPAGAKLKLLKWNEKFAYVSYKSQKGYVLANYIKPADEDYLETAIDTIPITDTYTYEQMMADLHLFESKYPHLVALEILGQSELGRDIPVIRVGNADAEYHVLIQSAIHGREHMTAWLSMALLDYWLDRDLSSYGDVCFHVIPMINPDGVSIVQSDSLPEYLEEIYKRDVALGYASGDVKEYLSEWKANGLGVDLNRNFDAGWKKLKGVRKEPSNMLYPGDEAFSAVEARILRDYTLRYPFDATISYHAMGSIIYYDYGKNEPVNSQSKSLAKAVKTVTGYPLLIEEGGGGGGYKDWVIESLDIPSLTIEIGSQQSPLKEREVYSLFVRNCNVLPAIAKWLQK